MTIGRIPSVEGGIQPTIVDAKGDLIVATAADTPARLAVGNSGDTLVADSAATTGLRWSSTPSASNPVINGAFDIWQRGTSFANSASALAYTADRWYQARNATGMTISRQVTNDTTNLPFIQYCSRVARDSGNTSTEIIRIVQSLETVNSIPFLGKTVTLSFYARKGANYSDANSQITAQVLTGTGTDQNINTISGAAFPIAGAATLTTTWQRFSYTGTLSSSASQVHILFYGTPVGTAGAADYFEVTGVQLDIGSVALPFRRTGGTIQGELAACQRYYYRNKAETTTSAFGSGYTDGTTAARIFVPLPVTMRTRPTALEQSGTAADYRVQLTGGGVANGSAVPTFVSSTLTTAVVEFTSSGMTGGQGCILIATTNFNAYLGWSAEL